MLFRENNVLHLKLTESNTHIPKYALRKYMRNNVTNVLNTTKRNFLFGLSWVYLTSVVVLPVPTNTFDRFKYTKYYKTLDNFKTQGLYIKLAFLRY